MLRYTYIACHVLCNCNSCSGFWAGFWRSVCSGWPRPVPVGLFVSRHLVKLSVKGGIIVDGVSAGSRGGHFILCTYTVSWCQWPRGVRPRSTAPRLLRSWVRIPPGAWMSIVSVVCCQVEVSATS